MKKEGQFDRKSRSKLIQNASNLLNNTFWWKIRPTLGPSISEPKCPSMGLPKMPKYGITPPPEP